MVNVSDNFSRANGSLGSNWAAVVPNNAESGPNTFQGGILINNNGYGPINAFGGDACALWNGQVFKNDQFASAAVKTVASFTAVLSITAATQSGGNTTYTYTVISGSVTAVISGGALYVKIAGMQNSVNNGTFTATTFGVNTFTVANASGTTEAGSSGTGNCASDSGAGVMVRGSGMSSATLNGYFFHVGTNSFGGGGRIAYQELWKVVNGVGTSLGLSLDSGAALVLPSPGDTLSLYAVGNSITAYYNGAKVFQVNDSSLAAGVPGITSWSISGSGEYLWSGWTTQSSAPGNNGTTLNNFQAGDISYTSTQLVSDSLTEAATQIASDTFQRANSNPIGGNWSTTVGSGHQIASNAVEAGAAGSTRCGSRWNANSFNNDQYSEITFTSQTTGSFSGPGVRMNTSGGEAGYYALFLGTLGTAGNVFLQKGAGGANLTSVGATVSAGDTLRIQAVGTTLTVFLNGSAIIEFQDSTTSSGAAGIFSDVASIANSVIATWNGGNAAGLPTTFTTGGSTQVFNPGPNGAYAAIVDGASWARVWDNTQTWPADQYAEASLSNPTGNVFGPALRISISANTFYLFASVSGSANIYKVVAGTSTLLSSVTKSFVAADVYRLEAFGNLLVGKVNSSIVTAIVDSSIVSGNAGFESVGAGNVTTKNIKNWAAGSITSSGSGFSATPIPVFSTDAGPATNTPVFYFGNTASIEIHICPPSGGPSISGTPAITNVSGVPSLSPVDASKYSRAAGIIVPGTSVRWANPA